jgi:hypothetical protein
MIVQRGDHEARVLEASHERRDLGFQEYEIADHQRPLRLLLERGVPTERDPGLSSRPPIETWGSRRGKPTR